MLGEVFLRPLLQNSGTSGDRSRDLLGTSGVTHQYSDLPLGCLKLLVLLTCSTKSFPIELRQLIGFMNFIHDSNCNT